MTNIMFVLAGVLLTVGVLIGAGLQTRSVDRRCRKVAQLVQELHEREEALAKREEALGRSGRPHAIYQRHPTGA
jgi:uncharacterized membrane-anchored protein YhcB (DUF1043 family)